MSLRVERLAELLAPYAEEVAAVESSTVVDSAAEGVPVALLRPAPWGQVLEELSRFLELLLKWNARTNLTAIRDEASIVRRHFGESLFLAAQVGVCLRKGDAVLDFGSGAGFPGIPLQLLYPEVRVTLAESQGKKAAFLREAVRVLGLECEVWDRRVEQMPEGRRFEAVTLRAVDEPERAVREAEARMREGGVMALLAGETSPTLPTEALECTRRLRVPESAGRWLELYSHVPRGTLGG